MNDTTERHGERIKREILRMGLQLWNVDPSLVTARRIAGELEMTHGNVLHHFGTSAQLRDAIAYYAVKEGESRVIVSLIAMNHRAVAHFDSAQRLEFMRGCYR